MSTILKYQSLISDLNLSITCPDNDCQPVNKITYRWVKEDFSDGQSFLPNFIYDQNRGKKPRKNDVSDEYKCGMCALSFFESTEASANSVETIGGVSKLTRLLGYTHLAEGHIVESDGIASRVDDTGHFLFFELSETILDQKFTIINPL